MQINMITEAGAFIHMRIVVQSDSLINRIVGGNVKSIGVEKWIGMLRWS